MATFKHSGNAGDIIYALPCIIAHSKECAATLYLALDVPLKNVINHPVGNVMLNRKMFDMLKPLLEAQSYIKEVLVYNNEQIDYDLDKFREAGIHLGQGDICTWYNHVYPFVFDLSKTWIDSLMAYSDYFDKIVLCRTNRYHAKHINYMPLKKYYDKIIFIGVESEHIEFCREYFDVEYFPVKDFWEMASIINSCKLFISNQTMAFAIAEALKVPRVLEACPTAHNVHPKGDKGAFAFYHQHFHQLIDRFLAFDE